MRDDPDASGDDETPAVPDCPVCGDPVAFLTTTGPHDGTAGPCGCSVPPSLLAREIDSTDTEAGNE